MRKWLIYSTLLAIYSDRLLIYVGPLTLYYFYFVVLFNLLLLAALNRLWFPPKMLCFLGYLTASGVFGLFLGTNSIQGFLKAYIGIFVCTLYYVAFTRLVNFDLRKCFDQYATLSFYAAVFGILYLPFQSDIKGRLTSVVLEPSAYCIICLPAAFYYADIWERERRYGWRLIIILVSFVLTFSSVGFISLAFGIYRWGLRYRYGKLALPAVVFTFLLITYMASDLFRIRMDDSFQAAATSDLTGVNQSSFGLALGYLVTRQEFLESPLLGGGLGSHVVAHDRFVGKISGASEEAGAGFLTLGRWDASSLFLRIVSELGLVGVGYTCWFLWYFWPTGGTPSEKGIANAVLCYIFAKFVRAGSYLGSEQFFFLAVFVMNGANVRLRHRLIMNKPLLSPEPGSTLAHRPA